MDLPYPNSLRKSLFSHGVDSKLIDSIYEGYDDIGDKAPKTVKIRFMRRAMQILDANFNFEQRSEIIGDCACCLGGSREKNIKIFVKNVKGKDLSLADRLREMKDSHAFSETTRLNSDGTITDGVYYQVNGEYKCACSCIANEKLDEPISSSYCLCCAGHFRHHLQNALGNKLRVKSIDSSPLSSLGKEPCEFTFEVIG